MLSTDTETLKKIKVQKIIFTHFSLGWKLKTSRARFSKVPVTFRARNQTFKSKCKE